MRDLSVVVPVYRCEKCLRALYDRVTSTVAEITSRYEIVFVDDRSPDGAWSAIRELAALDSHVKAVRLSRTSASTPRSRPVSPSRAAAA